LEGVYRTLEPFTGARPFRAEDCVGRLYNRLNADYQPLHALCRFFLANAAPGHMAGEHAALPFMVRMDELFEKFVAEWLKKHLPPELSLYAQEAVAVTGHGQVNFKIDMVLYRTDTGAPVAVLDTKYKVAGGPTSDDFAQVVTYAQLKGCRDAMLVYPVPLARELDVTLRDVRVRSLAFAVGGGSAGGGDGGGAQAAGSSVCGIGGRLSGTFVPSPAAVEPGAGHPAHTAAGLEPGERAAELAVVVEEVAAGTRAAPCCRERTRSHPGR
jgi:5-methylcytosine-specific restriction enzyme subunit McrC